MKAKKSISTTLWGLALTLVTSLFNNANASLIVGLTEGTQSFSAGIVVDDETGEGAFSRLVISGLSTSSEDIYISINDVNNSFEKSGILSSSFDQLSFSTSTCGVYSTCLNKFKYGELINGSWFDGTNGNASVSTDGLDYLYYYNSILEENVEEGNVEGDFDLGSWEHIGDIGYVAFAYIPDSIFYTADSSVSNELRAGEITQIWSGDDIQFGFLEIERGSISVNQVAFQNVRGDVTNVPEPSSLLLLAMGLLGIVSRKKQIEI